MPKKPDTIFRSFDPDAELFITERNLPHWFQTGAAMFITMRAADSLPKSVVESWQEELRDWLVTNRLPIELAELASTADSTRHEQLLGTLNDSQRRSFKILSDRIFHRSLDECHGKCLLRTADLAEIVAKSILFFNEERYDLDCFVVMPNHVHALVQFREGESLKTVSQSWMRYTARQINFETGDSGTFWQPEPFDHIIRSHDQFEYLQRYVFENPKKANLNIGEFVYWKR